MSRVLQLHVLVFGAVRQVRHSPAVHRAPAKALAGLFFFDSPEKFLEQFRDLRLLVVSDRQVNGLVGSHALRVRLHVAAHCDDDCIRIQFFGLVDHLPALSVRDIGDCTGVDHIDVRLFFKGDGIVPEVLHFLPHNVQFIAVYFAAEVVKCYTFQYFPTFFFSLYNIDFSTARTYY